MRYKILFFFSTVLLFSTGCDIINPDEGIPTYIKIDRFDLSISDPSVEGSAAHDITNAWIYYNNTLIGVYDLPCTAPILTEGDMGELSIIPGITLNGLVDLQPTYPFYKVDTLTLASKPGEVFEYTPTTSYLSRTEFRYKEDFEIGSSFEPLYDGVGGETAINRTTNPEYVFEGGAGGVLQLNETVTLSESRSKTGFPLPQGESFIEINYKCSVPFEVGLYNTLDDNVDAFQYLFGVKASDTWKKIYIELGSYTSANKGTDHKVIIKAQLPDGQSTGYVALDNIKVVSF